jgi:hypothetical protein
MAVSPLVEIFFFVIIFLQVFVMGYVKPFFVGLYCDRYYYIYFVKIPVLYIR